jgi:hypothetical protein
VGDLNVDRFDGNPPTVEIEFVKNVTSITDIDQDWDVFDASPPKYIESSVRYRNNKIREALRSKSHTEKRDDDERDAKDDTTYGPIRTRKR